MKVDVILPAAGRSERMKYSTRKQFIKVLGKHIIAYTVDCFHRFSWVRHIVVVVSPDCLEFTKELLESYGFNRVIVCAGAETRHRSIYCGIKVLQTECADFDVVIIHDGARPLVPEDVALKVAQAAEIHGAAGVTRNLVSTVIRGNEDDKLVESLDRRLYRNSEMPQAFHYSIIAGAYEKCTDDDLDFGTECLLLAMKYSHSRAYLVEGTDDLWKVTHQRDVYSMESIIKNGVSVSSEKLTVVSTINCCSQPVPAIQALHSRLDLTQIQWIQKEEDPANTFVVFVNSDLNLLQLYTVTSRISECYNKLPYSAVGLDMLVILVFLTSLVRENTTNERLGSRTEAQPSIYEKDTINLTAQNQISGHSCDLNIAQTLSGTSNSAQKHHCTELSETSVGHSSNDYTTESRISVSKHDVTIGLSSSGNLANQLGLCRSQNCNSPTMGRSMPESHSVDGVYPSEGSLHQKHSDQSKLELDDMQLEQSECAVLSHQAALVQEMKDRLKQKGGRKSALVVGVSSKPGSSIDEQLGELIWQRSSVLDNQVLTFN